MITLLLTKLLLQTGVLNFMRLGFKLKVDFYRTHLVRYSYSNYLPFESSLGKVSISETIYILLSEGLHNASKADTFSL